MSYLVCRHDHCAIARPSNLLQLLTHLLVCLLQLLHPLFHPHEHSWITAMLILRRPFNLHFANRTGYFDFAAICLPVLFQCIEVWIELIIALKRTANAKLPTGLPVLLSSLVFEFSVTFFALEGHLLKHLHSESVRILCQNQLLPTLRAWAILLLPDHDTFLAKQLIALLALFGLLNDLQTNCAKKEVINTEDSR